MTTFQVFNPHAQRNCNCNGGDTLPIYFCTVTRDECGGFGEEEVSVTGKRDIPIHMWLVDSSKSD